MNKIKIAPSLLSANFLNLEKDLIECINAGAEILHFDIMDGHFVPNITFGPMLLKSLKPLMKNILADVHLMIENSSNYIPVFAEYGADMISVHVENNKHLYRVLQLIKSFKIKAGIVLNPLTPLEYAYQAAEYSDFILLMSVNPGFGGQDYISSFEKKCLTLKNYLIKNNLKNVEIEVDGGIKADNVNKAVENGANIIVSGSGIFNGNIKENILKLRENANKAISKFK